jgi:protoheme IX farnesyltransferase
MIATIHLPGARPWSSAWLGARLADYWSLTKPEVNILIGITTLAGFCLGSARPQGSSLSLLLHTLLGTMLVAGGAAALNHFAERGFDVLMRRTARRPLPAGRISAPNALVFGIVLSTAGGIYLVVAVNALASVLALITLATYIFLYTPLKRRSPVCTLVGSLPGATPPLIGWAAATGGLDLTAWVLFGMVFLWQFPHFMGIAWMYRDDYDRAGYQILPRGGSRGRFMSLQILLPTLALVPLSLAPVLQSRAGLAYAMGAALFGSAFSYYGARLAVRRTNAAARRLLLASILYLPLVFALMLLDKV